MEFVNRVNEVGVDVNRCVNQSHTASLIQFVCGLGPRKGYNLLKVILFKLSLGTNDFVQIISSSLFSVCERYIQKLCVLHGAILISE